VAAFVATRLQLSAGAVTIVDAARVSATSVFFAVDKLEQADLLVSNRFHLKDSGVTLYEVLSPEERAQHARLIPQFTAARAAGRHAQFSRARLFVDQHLVPCPP
jgi:G3E family GTPase